MAKSKARTTTHLRKFALSTVREIDLSTTIQAYIIAPNGNYLSAVNGGGIRSEDSGLDQTALRTDATSPGKLGSFTLVVVKNMFALRTANGCYVTAVGGGGVGDTLLETGFHQPIVTDGTSSNEYSIFSLIPLTGKQVAIGTSDGQHYVTAVDGGGFDGRGNVPIRTVATKPGSDELFTLQVLVLMSKTHNGPN